MSKESKTETIWRIISQVNLEEIQAEVEKQFHLLIGADHEAVAEELARHLSDEMGTFSHPWISTETPPIQVSGRGIDRADLAIVLSQQADLPSTLWESYRALLAIGVPTLIVTSSKDATHPDTRLARHGQEQWVTVSQLDADAVHGPVASALLSLTSPGLRLALARRLPPLRPAAFRQLIQETCQANAAYSFGTGLAEIVPVLDIPLNVSDIIVLTKNQLLMAYKIALISGKQGRPQDLIGEIVGVLGGGFFFRQIARQLVGLIPVWGVVPKVGMAYAGTWAIGQAMVLWTVEGRRITPDLLNKFYTKALVRCRGMTEDLTRRMHRKALTAQSSPEPLVPQGDVCEGRIDPLPLL